MVVGLVTRLGTKATTDFCWGDFDVLFILIIQCHIDTNGEVEFRYVNFLQMYILFLFTFTFNQKKGRPSCAYSWSLNLLLAYVRITSYCATAQNE